MSDATCIAAHDDDPPLALPGLRLCRHHHGRLARDLADIVTCWSLLAELHEPGRGGTGTHGKRADPPAPVNLDVADITDPRTSQVIAAMGWARIVVEDRRLAVLPSDVAECAGLLTRHLEWVSAQDWADEACAEISAAARTLRWACGERNAPPIGTCRAPDPRNPGQDCGGPLHWIDGTLTVRCVRCHDTWSEADLVGMARIVDVWLPTNVVSSTLGVPMRTVQHWAATGVIRRLRHGIVSWTDAHKRHTG